MSEKECAILFALIRRSKTDADMFALMILGQPPSTMEIHFPTITIILLMTHLILCKK